MSLPLLWKFSLSIKVHFLCICKYLHGLMIFTKMGTYFRYSPWVCNSTVYHWHTPVTRHTEFSSSFNNYIIWLQHILYFHYPVSHQLTFILHMVSQVIFLKQNCYYIPIHSPQSKLHQTFHCVGSVQSLSVWALGPSWVRGPALPCASNATVGRLHSLTVPYVLHWPTDSYN